MKHEPFAPAGQELAGTLATDPEAPLTQGIRQQIQDRLFSAIVAKSMVQAKELLSLGASPSAPGGPNRRTPLMAAASTLDFELIKLFLPLNDVHAVDDRGFSALSLFVKHIVNDLRSPLREFSPDKSCACEWRRALGLLLSAGPRPLDAHGPSPLAIAAASWLPLDTFIALASVLAPASNFSELDAQGLTAYSTALSSLYAGGGKKALALLEIDPMASHALRACSPTHGYLAHVAARNGEVCFLSTTSHLIDFDARDSRGRTPLMAAADTVKTHSPICLEFLLEHSDPLAVDCDGCDALMLFIERHCKDDFAEDGLKQAISRLVCKSNLWARDSLGESALDKATDRKMRSLASLILSTRHHSTEVFSAPALNLAPSLDKLQELFFQAVELGETELAKKRLEQGACPRRPSPTFNSAHFPLCPLRTPLIVAAKGQSKEMIQFLAPLSNLMDRDAYGNTALLARLRQNSLKTPDDISIMRTLFSPEVALASSVDGTTLLSAANAPAGLWPDVMAILGPVCDWMALDAKGNNILALQLQRLSSAEDRAAIWNAHPDSAWLASSSNHDGETLAHIAARRRSKDILLLIAPHANFGAKDRLGRTPLACACSAEAAFEAAGIVAILAPWSDCRAVDLSGCDALMLIIESSRRKDDLLLCVKELVDRADLEARDFLGESALDKAIARNRLDVVAIIRSRMAIFAERDALASLSPIPEAQTAARAIARI